MHEPDPDDDFDDAMPQASSSSHTPNPTGINQHKNCPPKDDPRVKELLTRYHHRNVTNAGTISSLLLVEHGISMSAPTVKRRRKELGLFASRKMTALLPDVAKEGLIREQLAKDPLGRLGPRTIKERLSLETGIHLSRDYISGQMHQLRPEDFASRSPTAKKIHREPLVAIGIHHEWSCDGHDKLSARGFPIWGIKEKYCGKWLKARVIPNNRLKLSVAYLWLSLVAELGGMSLQTTTDCGTETVEIFGFANALREAFSPEFPVDELPAHRFLRSVHNITVERGWHRLCLQWGDNVKVYFDAGQDMYNPADPRQYELVQWLWPNLVQKDLDDYIDRCNNHRVRYDKTKKLPSGVSPNVTYALHEQYGALNCLQSVDVALVRQLMEDIGGESLVQFVSVEYAAHAQAVFDRLTLPPITLQNAWEIFRAMLPHM